MKKNAVLQQCPVLIKTLHFLKGFAQTCKSHRAPAKKRALKNAVKRRRIGVVISPCVLQCFFVLVPYEKRTTVAKNTVVDKKLQKD